MATTPGVKAVELEGEFYHVRFRSPDEFSDIRTPEWARTVAQSVSAGSEVRMGKRPGSDEWLVQSVLIRKNVGARTARRQAERVLMKIED